MKQLTGLLFLAAAAYAQDLQLFLLIGQSNMAGRGVVESADREPIPGVMMLNKALEWAPAVDPLHFDKPEIAGVGLGRTFAQTLLQANPKMKIGLIPAAFGGSALDEWKPGSAHYENAVKRTREALKKGMLRGILWHQGESDSSSEEKVASYGARWQAVMKALRAEFGTVPIVVGGLGEFRQAKVPLNGQMNEELARLSGSANRVAYVPSGGLVHKGDDVHFNTPSLRELGRRYAQAYLMLDGEWVH